ncbi:MAG TPA: TonB-dependent receptor [Terriglobales bacterium]|nr:TonB-dependent receptor [Terriglobales bacterium]
MQRLSPMSPVSLFHSSSPSIVAGAGQIKFQKALALSVLFFSLLMLLSALAPLVKAQEVTGSIVGTVTDPSGAAISGAEVTAKDVDRGTVLATISNAEGAFSIPRVPIGNYQVRAEAKGFQAVVNPTFNLVLNQTVRLNFQMKVGQASETVEVSAAAPLLQTDTTLLGNIIDSQAVVELPLSTRNLNQLTLIAAPGVVTPNLFGFQAAQNTFGTGRPYVNGAREQENNFILDGMDNNQPDNNDVGFVPAPDAVQEFNLITGNAPADFGNYLGGVVNVTLKSGTNKFHGNVYEFMRRGGWNANSWTNNANGIARPGLHWDDFGGTFGGPILKDKLFFFADYQESRFSQPAVTTQLQTISLANRGGDFSSICTAGFTNGICNDPTQQLFNPFSSPNPASRTPFLNNQIPTSLFNSASQTIISSPLYPNSEVANNVQNFKTNSYQGDLKFDFVPSEKDHIMGRWSQQYVINNQSNSIGLLGDFVREFPLKNAVVDWTRTFSANWANDARIGFSYFPVTEAVHNATGQNLPATFGIQGVAVDFLPAMVFSGSGVLPGTIGSNDLAESFHDTTLQFNDSATWSHNKHVIHFGLEAYHYIMNDLYPGNAGLAGQFNFNGQFTGNTGSSGGNPVADFLLGLPQTVQQGNGGGGNKYLRNSLFGVFGQDNWRVLDNLTLNIGLRYELTTARRTNNGQDVNFDLITGAPQIGKGYSTYGGINNFQPRIGFAWQPGFDRNTVIRAAYGISTFMEANGVNNLPYQNPPFVQAHTADFSGLALPGSTLDQGFANFPASACTVAALQALSPACLASNTLHLTNPNLQPAVDQQWNLSIQRQLGKTTSVQVGYVGNKIDHMSDIFIFNQLVLNPDGTTSPGPFAQPLINCCGAGNSPRIRFNDSSGIQRYNALQGTVVQRAWQGLQLQANYTWSKCLSNSLGYFGQFGDEEALPGTVSQTNSSFFFQDNYNAKGDYGRCIADVASLFNGYVTYDVPFGHGRPFGGNLNPALEAILGGWVIGSDFTLHSGFAINPGAPDQSGTHTSGRTRPDCVPGVSQSGSGDVVTIGGVTGIQFLNPGAVALPAQGTFGNCAAGSFRGPGLKTMDLNLSKQFRVTEASNFLLRAEFINLTNTPIFGAPNATAGSTFGFISSSNPGRQIQLAAKFNF